MAEEGRPLLLHATIVNTIYVKGRNKGRKGQKLELDARDLISKYEDYVWLEGMEVDKITLCKMGAKDVGEEGDQAYEVEAEVTF